MDRRRDLRTRRGRHAGGHHALGTLLSGLMSVGELEDLGPATYGELFREAITDLLEPRDIPAPGRALPVG